MGFPNSLVMFRRTISLVNGRVQVDPQKESVQKIVLIAWNKSVEKQELEDLCKELKDQNYRVDVVDELSKLDKQLLEYEKKDETPAEVVSHFHFPKIPLSGLNRRISRRLNEISPNSTPRITSVTQRLLGADLHQFAIDCFADEMVKAADLPKAILDVFKSPNSRELQGNQKLPVVHAALEDQQLESKLAELFKMQKQRLNPVKLTHREDKTEVRYGVLLISETAIDRLAKQNPPLPLMELTEATGVVVILDKQRTIQEQEERERSLYLHGALDCISPGTSEKEMVHRVLSARRNRARTNLENQYHNALKKNSREWKVFQEVSSIEAASIIHDDEGKIYFVNEAATNLFGYDEKTFEQMYIRSLHPANYEKTRKEIYEHFCENGSVKWEAKFVKANGDTFEALLTASPANEFSEGKQLICCHVHSLEDNKFLKKSVSKMMSAGPEALDENIRSVLKDLSHLIDGIRSVQIFRKEGLTGVREPGWSSPQIIDTSNNIKLSLKKLWAVFEAGEKYVEDDSSSVQADMPRAVKEIRTFVLPGSTRGFTVVPLKIGSKILGCIAVELEADRSGMQWDATTVYRKQLLRSHLSFVALMIASGIEKKRKDLNRKILEQSRFQEDKKRSINNITDGIAHDFNNLLQSISGHVSLLLRSESLDEKEKKSLRSVKSAAELGASLSSRIRDLTTPSKEVTRFSLHKLIREVSELVTSSLVSNHDPILNLHSNLDIVNCDRSQVHQVFMNLFTNANDAMRDFNNNGVITISSKILINQFGQKMIQVTFSDEGPGIKKDEVFKIFEPYFSSKTETKQGTGMGLWIIHRIMRHHGGSIRVGNNQSGATFELEWPLVEEGADHMELPSGIYNGQGTVLIVDDDAMVNESCKLLLEHMGFRTMSVFDGFEAVRKIQTHGDQIDLVILDQKMPGMSGAECFSRLVKLDKDIKVVICSGNQIEISGFESARNIVGVLPKPYTLRDLSRMMKLAEVVQD